MNKKKIVEKIFSISRAHQFILFLIPFLLFLQTCWFNFTYHDDDTIVLNNGQVFQNFNLKKIFFSDAWLMDKKIELYRPFQSFTYAIDYFFTGTNPFGYHLHNVLIFCLSIQLLYLFLLSLKLTEQVSFFSFAYFFCSFFICTYSQLDSCAR